ncbi:pectinesterase 3-like [Telopea speciosissima]|uniref:pectinesterase 3-like n=1 Tax=Telopea speciosissima TaxID=54955 RepID=UPI001CC4BCA3|nr:pectinesterase 3-like [Telopea speciosissima]
MDWENGTKAKEDPRKTRRPCGGLDFCSEEESSYSNGYEYDNEGSSSTSTPSSSSSSSCSSRDDYRYEGDDVLVVAGCKRCFMYFICFPNRSKSAPNAMVSSFTSIDRYLDELLKTGKDLRQYRNVKKTIFQHADDLKTLVSAAMTNQESCLDGFSHDGADKEVKAVQEAGQVHVYKICSNALAMIKNMTDTHMAEERKERRLMMGDDIETNERGSEFPEWLSAGDQRLLQAMTVTAYVTVAADGSGNFKTVAAAVAAAPEKSSKRYVIIESSR